MSEFAVYETIVRSRSPSSDAKPTASQKLRDTLDDSALPRYHMSYYTAKREPGCVNRILHAIPPLFYVAGLLLFLFTTLVVGSCLANANAKNESLRQGVEALALRLEMFRTAGLNASTENPDVVSNPLIDQHLESLDAFLTNASEWRTTAEALKAQKDELVMDLEEMNSTALKLQAENWFLQGAENVLMSANATLHSEADMLRAENARLMEANSMLQDDLAEFKMNRTTVLAGVKNLTDSMALDLSKKLVTEHEMIAQFLAMETKKLEAEEKLLSSLGNSTSGKPSNRGDDAMAAAEAPQVDGQELPNQGSPQEAAVEAAGEKDTFSPIGDEEQQTRDASKGIAADGSGNGVAAPSVSTAAAGVAASP